MAHARQPLFVNANHPSLVDAFDRFITEAGDGRRYFGRRRGEGRAATVALTGLLRGPNVLGMAAVDDGRIVAMACVGDRGEVITLTVADWRARRVSNALSAAVLDRFDARVARSA
jgi:hypothetical protein